MAANLLVSDNGEIAQVSVVGRANFQNSEDLKVYCHQMLDQGVKVLSVNLAKCEGMDSTFMGMLAMISLSAQEKDVPLEIAESGESNKALLVELGLDVMLKFTEAESVEEWQDLKGDAVTQEGHSDNILKAHETLMDLNDSNKAEFQNVVKFLKQQEGK